MLHKLLDDVAATLLVRASNEFPETDVLVEQVKRITQHLTASLPPNSVQDDFRRRNGFSRLIDVLRAYSGFYSPQRCGEHEKESLFALLGIVLDTLSAAFRSHPGNRRYFRTKVDGGGWDALTQTIASSGLIGSDYDLWTSGQLFGKLLAFTLEDPALSDICTALCSKNTSPQQQIEQQKYMSDEDVDKVKVDDMEGDIARVEYAVQEAIGPTTTLQNPEMVSPIIDFWIAIPRNIEKRESIVSLFVLKTLASVIETSTHNLCLVYDADILSRLLQLAFGSDSELHTVEKKIAEDICRSLMFLGVKKLVDAQAILTNPSASSSDFCLDLVERHHTPPFIQFDLSLHGHSSIDLPSLGRPFPPQSSAGYTFAAWIRIDQFDPSSHTTIFGAFDSSQSCFLLLYLEKDTHNFILQTSVTSQRPSVRFKSVAFVAKKWYHIALVHRRPKTMTSSKASLYVNGEFVEQIRASYPAPPPLFSGSTESFASFTSSNTKQMPVQAFLGTPRDLSTRLGPGLMLSKWSLATAHLFEDVISDDLLAVPGRLGPRYQANFQDCLGGFQTYTASAALGLRNEMVSTGKDGMSDIIRVIRDKAGLLIPEQRILFSMTPSSIFCEKDSLDDSPLFHSLSRGPATALVQMILKNNAGIAINAALPSVNDALLRSTGVAVLSGEPIVAVPQYFDDAMWRLAGFTPLALKLIDRASTSDGLVRAVQMVFRCINSSWRNSDAVERAGGYAILGMLLGAKVGFSTAAPDSITDPLDIDNTEKQRLSFQLLGLVLEFIGYNARDPLESVIINPLAYRILLIDFDGWRKCAPIIQELYYKQFHTFAVMSKYHQYNNRRLLRMRK